MRINARTLLVFAYALVSVTASSTAKAEVNEVLANMAHEATTCAVYFGLVEQTLKGAVEANGATQYHAGARNLLTWAYELAKYAGLKSETIDATIQVEAKRLMARIDNNSANLMILINEYGEFCKELEKHPAERSRYWLDWQSHH